MARLRRIRYVPDRKSFRAFMLSEQMRDVTTEVANDIAKMAGQLAPGGGDDTYESDNDIPLSKNFKVQREAGIHVIVTRGHTNPRVKVVVYNDLRHAAAVEFGQGKHGSKKGARRMLGRAGAMFGDFAPRGGPEL